jgi:hypothetical protein
MASRVTTRLTFANVLAYPPFPLLQTSTCYMICQTGPGLKSRKQKEGNNLK